MSYTREQLTRIAELDAAIDAVADQGDQAFFSAVAAKDEYIDSQGIDRDLLEKTGREVLNNVLGEKAQPPFYIWANEDCANSEVDFEAAKRIRLALINEGHTDVYIVDADGVEVVDDEIMAHEAMIQDITGELDVEKAAPAGATHLAGFYGRVSYYQKVEHSHLNQVSEQWQTLDRWNVWEKGAWVDAGAGFSSRRLQPLAPVAESDEPSNQVEIPKDRMKVTTLADGTQLQYIKVSGSLGPRWLSHANSLLTTDRPEHAQGLLPGEALKIYQHLVRLGYKGLSLTNAVPVADREVPGEGGNTPSSQGLPEDALPINWAGSGRWTMDRGAMPGEAFAFLDGDREDAVAAMYEVQSPGKPACYEVRLPGGAALSQADSPAEAARLAQLLVDAPDGDAVPERPRCQG